MNPIRRFHDKSSVFFTAWNTFVLKNHFNCQVFSFCYLLFLQIKIRNVHEKFCNSFCSLFLFRQKHAKEPSPFLVNIHRPPFVLIQRGSVWWCGFDKNLRYAFSRVTLCRKGATDLRQVFANLTAISPKHATPQSNTLPGRKSNRYMICIRNYLLSFLLEGLFVAAKRIPTYLKVKWKVLSWMQRLNGDKNPSGFVFSNRQPKLKLVEKLYASLFIIITGFFVRTHPCSKSTSGPSHIPA